MARPERKDVDYFPFYVKNGRTLQLLEGKYQCKGTGFFTNVLRFLSTRPDHYFSIAEESDRLWFFLETKCDEKSAIDMLNIMAITGKINSELWKHKIIISEDYLESVADAYRKRSNKIITIEEVFAIFGINPNKNNSGGNPNNSGGNPHTAEFPAEETHIERGKRRQSGVGNPQSKVKESKVKEIYVETSNEVRLSKLLFDLIRERKLDFKKPDLQKWAVHIDRMIRLDKRKPDIITNVIEWAQADADFWQNNILSTEKLRKQFDQLELKMNQDSDIKTIENTEKAKPLCVKCKKVPAAYEHDKIGWLCRDCWPKGGDK